MCSPTVTGGTVFLVPDDGGFELVAVSGLDAAPGAEARFLSWVAVLDGVARADLGEDHDAWSAHELRALEAAKDKQRLFVLAVRDGEPVGAGTVIVPLLDNEGSAQVAVAVLPEARRRGLGATILHWAEDRARRLGRTTLQAETEWLGGIDDDPHAGWAARQGYAAAQTVLRCDLDLRGAPDAAVGQPTGYRIETHVGPAPESDLADRAHLLRRLSTDAPMGDLALEEEQWDEDRVREDDERALAMGRGVIGSYARHLASGRLVGYTTIQVPEDTPALAYQHDTLVLAEHRGHGLGLALKVANHGALAEALPRVRTVRTWNAVENEPMLAVNAVLGYAPSGYSREWQKHLAP